MWTKVAHSTFPVAATEAAAIIEKLFFYCGTVEVKGTACCWRPEWCGPRRGLVSLTKTAVCRRRGNLETSGASHRYQVMGPDFSRCHRSHTASPSSVLHLVEISDPCIGHHRTITQHHYLHPGLSRGHLLYNVRRISLDVLHLNSTCPPK